MNKEKIAKINVSGGVMTKDDMTPDEKKALYEFMRQYDATWSYTYIRCFRDGFAEWELQGIWKCKIEYLKLLQTDEKLPIEVRCTETIETEEGETYKYRHFYRTADGEEHSFDITAPGEFWLFLGDIRKRVHFGEYMARLGMKSLTTVTKRFTVDDWKEYEKVGIRSIIESFLSEYQNTNKE